MKLFEYLINFMDVYLFKTLGHIQLFSNTIQGIASKYEFSFPIGERRRLMEKCKILFCLFLCVNEIQATKFCLNADFVAENDISFSIYMYFLIFLSPVSSPN